MPTLTTRLGTYGKGSALSHAEMDANWKRPVTAVTSTPVTLTEAHNRNIIECDTGSGTLALTAAATLAAIDTEDWFVDIVNTSSSHITIDPDGSETIDGANTYTIASNNSIRVFLNAAKTGFRTFGGFFYTMSGGMQTLAYTSSGQFINPNTGAVLSVAGGHGLIVPYTGHITLVRTHVRLNTLDKETRFFLLVNGVSATLLGTYTVGATGARSSGSISVPVIAGDLLTIQFYHTSTPTTGAMSNFDFTLALTA